MRNVYLDHSATSYVLPEVLEEMLPYFTDRFGNPSSLHSFGRSSRKTVDDCREQVAELMGVDRDEVIFTGSGSESDNMAIVGSVLALKHKGNHIITSTIEHHAVDHACRFAEQHLGAEVTRVPVDSYGRLDLDMLESSIKPQTILVTIMTANNEIGTTQDIDAIHCICKKKNVRFHTDAVQAIGLFDMDLKKRPIDLVSFASHKFYGPKGVGCLLKLKDVKVIPLVQGGSQEFGLRAGTENVPGIVGLTKALEIAIGSQNATIERLRTMRDRFLESVLKSIPETSLNGHPKFRLPHNANIGFKRIEGESILLQLDLHGIAASSGSACTSKSLSPSHVLTAMGIDPAIVHGSVRFTLGQRTTDDDITYVLDVLPGIIEKLRSISAVY